MAENHISTRPPITRKPHGCQADEDLVARFICHANSTHVLQSLWRGLSRRTLRTKPGSAPRRAARSYRRAGCRNVRSQKHRTLQEETPDSPGRNTGLSRKKHRTLQEETPDSPGRNTGLSRKKHRTLQEEIPDSPGRNTGLSRKKYRTLQEEIPDSPGNTL
jgi:hypothetical protein